MTNDLNGRRIAILATDGFEQVELTSPREALEKAGARCVVISPKSGVMVMRCASTRKLSSS